MGMHPKSAWHWKIAVTENEEFPTECTGCRERPPKLLRITDPYNDQELRLCQPCFRKLDTKFDEPESGLICTLTDIEEAEKWRDRLNRVIHDETAFIFGGDDIHVASVQIESQVGPAHEFHALFVKTEKMDFIHGTRRLADHLRGWMRGFQHE